MKKEEFNIKNLKAVLSRAIVKRIDDISPVSIGIFGGIARDEAETYAKLKPAEKKEFITHLCSMVFMQVYTKVSIELENEYMRTTKECIDKFKKKRDEIPPDSAAVNTTVNNTLHPATPSGAGVSTA